MESTVGILPREADVSISYKIIKSLKSAFGSWIDFSIPIFLMMVGILIGTIVGTIITEQYYKSQFILVPKSGVSELPTGQKSLAEVLASGEMERKINEK